MVTKQIIVGRSFFENKKIGFLAAIIGGRMRFAGIDIGSRTIELVVVDESGEIEASHQADTGFDPITEAQKDGGWGPLRSNYGHRIRSQPVRDFF
jgi:hypothetical protein